MEFVCRRCQHVTKQTPYRVTSEEGGVVLINMLVCASCARLAKRLGLPVIKMKSAKRATEPKTLHALADNKQEHVPRRPYERIDCEVNSGAVLHAKSSHPVELVSIVRDQNGRRGRAHVRR
jgi:hypothetical protein